jgi:hypothetical protein
MAGYASRIFANDGAGLRNAFATRHGGEGSSSLCIPRCRGINCTPGYASRIFADDGAGRIPENWQAERESPVRTFPVRRAQVGIKDHVN